MSVTQVPLSSLEPYSLYRFRVRCRFAAGLWSEWSEEVSGQTEEEGEQEAPATTLPPCSDSLAVVVFLDFRFENCFLIHVPSGLFTTCLWCLIWR